MTVSKEKTKFIKSLHQKKYRNELKLFLVEGEKNIQELFHSDFEIELLIINKIFEQQDFSKFTQQVIYTGEKEITQLSTYEQNSYGIAVVKQKENTFLGEEDNLIVVCDTLRDPGNLGTIIRICDWYGVKHLILSNESVDFYNPKVITSTMGSFSRVQIFYTDLIPFLSKQNRVIYGAFLEGKNIHKTVFDSTIKNALIIGSESHGISQEIGNMVNQKITIPRIGQAESLNAGIATGIILDNFYRNI